MSQDVGPESLNDPWFFEDFDIFLDGAVCALRIGAHIFDGVVALRTPGDFIDQARMVFDRHVFGETVSIVNMWTLGDIVSVL